jgi:hypothetical protein
LIRQTFFETRENQAKIKSLFPEEIAFNTLVQEKIPFYKRLSSNGLTRDQNYYLKSLQNFQLRGYGSIPYTLIKSGKDELEDEIEE